MFLVLFMFIFLLELLIHVQMHSTIPNEGNIFFRSLVNHVNQK